MSELLVPVRVDALWLKHGRRVVGPPADVEQLPWFDGRRDRNGSVPHVASAINAPPFGEHQGWLEPGVHLHWALPDALTRGTNTRDALHTVPVDGLWFAPVPNRWLVVLRLPKRNPETIAGQWLIESDYVHPPGPRRPDAIAYPIPDPPAGTPPYVYLGRRIAYNAIGRPTDPALQSATAADSLAARGLALTALGAGDPLFAAHYPSCRSVFGFHEPVPETEFDEPRLYSVFGWYRVLDDDPLLRLGVALRADPAQALSLLARAAKGDASKLPPHDAAALGAADWEQALRLAIAERLGWGISDASLAAVDRFPNLVLCLGATTVVPGVEPAQTPPPEAGTAGIGSSPGEALAAMLAHGANLNAQQEDRLVQALAATDLASHTLDLGLKLAEARHAEQFHAQPGHALWVIRPPEGKDGSTAAPPEELAHELNRLNTLQQQYDRAHDRIAALREALFADWHRWMTTAYPEGDADPFAADVDAIRELIVRTRLAPLESLRVTTGQLFHGRSAGGGALVTDRRGSMPDPGDTLARRVVEQVNAIRVQLAELADGAAPMSLGITPGPRFWRPNDPVLVLDDPVAAASARHGEDGRGQADGLHPCEATQAIGNTQQSTDLRFWPAGPPIGALASGNWWAQFFADHPAFVTTASGENWHPLQLEWEVEVQPLADRGDRLKPDFVTRSHALPPDAAELEPLPGLALVPIGSYASGRTIINPAAGRLLQSRLAQIPKDLPLPAAALAAAGQRVPMVLTLGGFHDQLLLRRQEPQIAIDDPIGLGGADGQRAFTRRVRQAIGNRHPATPLDDGLFHPVRSGELLIERLRVIDSFGRTKTWQPAELLKTRRMQPENGALDRARLPLRITQAARLDFRWCSAAYDDIETNDHPATSPVCGWLLPNELDDAVEIYSRQGRLLGRVEAGGVWQRAPGDDTAPRDWGALEDASLRRIVRWLTVPATSPNAPDMIGPFVELLDAALELTDPKDAAQHQARAVLIGRPLAVVRARLALALRKPAAPDPSMTALRARLAGASDDDHGLSRLEVPVRLGELNQHDDGLCGYWVEDGDGFRQDTFHTPHGLDSAVVHANLRVISDDALTDFPIRLTPDGPPAFVTLLIDPRGVAHASCGLLPTKSIEIPPEQYKDALAALRVTFTTAPVLTAPDAVALPLPAEPGYAWSWLERTAGGWVELPHHPTIHKTEFVAGFGTVGAALWDALVASGRIVLEDKSDRGLLMPGDRDAPLAALTALGLTAEVVERGLHDLAHAIDAVDTAARFARRAVARDGWLQLRPVPVPAQPVPPGGGTS